MRKIIPILLTLLALIAAFLVYFHFQPAVPTGFVPPAVQPQVEIPTTQKKDVFVGDGQAPWLKQFDRLGNLAYQFKADYYGNNPDGSVPVTRPVIEIFQDNGQIIHIEGIDGLIQTAPGEDRMSFTNAPHSPPRMGTLRDVVVKMYSSLEAEVARVNQPDLTLTMTNAKFENDTFRLFTQEYVDASGKTIRGEDVPVTLRAKDYDFDGSGLVMFWNGMDQQLKSLEIAHGKKLTIYSSEAFSPDSVSTQPAPTASAPQQITVAAAVGAPLQAPSAPTSAPAAAAPAPRPRYRATFYDNVRVVQAGQEIKNAKELQVDFKSGGNSTDSPGSSVPAADARSANSPANAPASAAPGAANPAKLPAASTAAAPSPDHPKGANPIEVTWTGVMRLVPVDDPATDSLPDGQKIVRFIGAPVQIHQSDAADQSAVTDINCATVIYRTADSILRLLGSADVPVTMTQKHADGTVSAVTTPSLQYSRNDRVAILEGQSDAQFPDPNDPQSVLTTDWSKSCIVHLLPDAKGQMQVHSADLAGNVTVDQPRFHLTSRDLALSFEPQPPQGPAGDKSSAPQLKEILATGDALCVIHEAQQRNRSIAGQKLHLITARGDDGKVYAKTVFSDGAAEAIADDEDLNSEHLQIDLKPVDTAKRGAKGAGSGDVELDTLHASENVNVKGDKSSVTGDDLKIVRANGFSHVTVLGKPAKVVNADSTIIGPEIHVSSEEQTSSVEGPGSLTTVQENADPAKPPRPLKVTWAQRAAFDSKANAIDIFGSAQEESNNPGGSDDIAQSEHLKLTLFDAASTQPSAQSASDKSATRPAEAAPTQNAAGQNAAAQTTLAGGEFDFMHNKHVKFISLLGKAGVQTTFTQPGGNLLRRSKLYGGKIDYDTIAQVLTIPGLGNMSIEDYETAAGGADAKANSSPGFHGQTVFDWQKQFIFDQGKRIGVIQGTVTVLHRDYAENAQTIRLDAEKVAAQFEPADAPPANVVGNAAAKPADDDTPRLQLSKMVAVGKKASATTYTPVKIVSGDTTIFAGQVEFDPKIQRITCRSGELGEVRFINLQHRDEATADEVWFNTKTNTIEKIVNLHAHRK